MKKFVWSTVNEIRKIRIRIIKELELGKNVIVTGKPIVKAIKGGKIIIEDGVTLNSNNKNYLFNLHSAVKLFADNPNAIIKIGKNTRLHGTSIYAREKVIIGENCLIAGNTNIIDSNGHDLSFDNIYNRMNTRGNSKPVIIEDCVWIGANTTILPGVTIGKGSVIGTGSVVTKDIPPMCFAAGFPAKVIKQYPISSH